MPIRVICPGCHATFNVSDKFGGKEGPCPKCKTTMQIPKASEQVVVHEAPPSGPTDSQGKSVLDPIKRKDSKYPMPVLIGAGVAAVMVPAIAFVLGLTLEENADGVKQGNIFILAFGAILLSLPVVLAGYSFMRNDELEPYSGKDLWVRGGICALVYALTWGIHAYLGRMMGFTTPMEMQQAMIALPAMIIPGTLASLATLDLDGFSAAVHYVFYLMVTVGLRLIMGVGAM